MEKCFTKKFLEKFPEIERQTIDILVNNGFTNETTLLLLDINNDLDNIQSLTMAQKTCLRRILTEYQKIPKMNDLRDSLDKKLSEELNKINGDLDINEMQNQQDQAKITTPQNTLTPPLLSPIDQQLSTSSTSHELIAICSNSSRVVPTLDSTLPLNSSKTTILTKELSINEFSLELSILPSNDIPYDLSIPSTSASSRSQTPRTTPRRNCRRFVKTIKRTIKREPKTETISNKQEVELISIGTDTRYRLNTNKDNSKIETKEETISYKLNSDTEEMSIYSSSNDNLVPLEVNFSNSDHKITSENQNSKSQKQMSLRNRRVVTNETPNTTNDCHQKSKKKKTQMSSILYDCLFENCSQKFSNSEELRTHRLNHYQINP